MNDLGTRFKVIDYLNVVKMTKYRLVMTPTLCRCGWVHYLYSAYVFRARALTYLLTYPVLTQLALGVWAYKTGNNPETVEDRVKVTINGLYKIVHGLSIAANMYDLERDSRSLIL